MLFLMLAIVDTVYHGVYGEQCIDCCNTSQQSECGRKREGEGGGEFVIEGVKEREREREVGIETEREIERERERGGKGESSQVWCVCKYPDLFLEFVELCLLQFTGLLSQLSQDTGCCVAVLKNRACNRQETEYSLTIFH